MRSLAIVVLAAACGGRARPAAGTAVDSPAASRPAAAPHFGYVGQAAISDDGRFAATWANDSLRVWELPTGNPVCVWELDVPAAERYVPRADDAMAMVFAGGVVTIGTATGRIRGYAVDGCQQVQDRDAHEAAVTALVATPRGLISGSADGIVRTPDGEPFDVGGRVGAIAVHPSGLIAVAYGGDSARAGLFDADGVQRARVDIRGAVLPFSAALWNGDDLVLVSGGDGVSNESQIFVADAGGNVRASVRVGADLILHGAVVGMEDPATLFALSFDGALWVSLGETPADPPIPLDPDVASTNKAQARRWAAHRAGEGWRVLVGDQDGNVAYLEVPSGAMRWKVDRTVAAKVSRDDCARLFDHAIALSRRAGSDLPWELPVPRALREGSRDEALADCQAHVTAAELRCNLGQTTYEGLATCDYFRFHCQAAACARPID